MLLEDIMGYEWRTITWSSMYVIWGAKFNMLAIAYAVRYSVDRLGEKIRIIGGGVEPPATQCAEATFNNSVAPVYHFYTYYEPSTRVPPGQ